MRPCCAPAFYSFEWEEKRRSPISSVDCVLGRPREQLFPRETRGNNCCRSSVCADALLNVINQLVMTTSTVLMHLIGRDLNGSEEVSWRYLAILAVSVSVGRARNADEANQFALIESKEGFKTRTTCKVPRTIKAIQSSWYQHCIYVIFNIANCFLIKDTLTLCTLTTRILSIYSYLFYCFM